jgi:flagellar hook-associated protein 3 FlgL
VRITQSTVVQQFIYNLQQSEQSMLTTEQQLSSGKRLLMPQDNPGGAALAMQDQAAIDSNTQYLANDQSAQSWITATGSALGEAGSILQQVQNLALQVNSPAADVPALTQSLSSLESQLMTVANSQFDGQYLFAGTDVTGTSTFVVNTSVVGGVTYTSNTSVTTPYAQYTTFAMVGTTPTTLQGFAYVGDGGTLSREIGPSTHMQVSVQGNVFTKALNDLSTMIWNLQNGGGLGASDLSNIQSDLSSIQTTQAVTGSWQQRLTQNTQSLQDQQTNLKTWLGDTQDVDVASAIVNLQQEQLAYQQALGVGAMMQQTTLLNYLHP